MNKDITLEEYTNKFNRIFADKEEKGFSQGETLQRGGSKSLILGWFVLGASGAPKNRNKR